MTKEELMRKAIELSVQNVAEGGGPFGAVIARNGEIIAMGVNRVTPGVSGGTIALLTGIFNELIGALNALLTPKAWKLLFKGSFREFWEYIHGTFLLWLGAGVVASVFSLAKLV